mmetsp:Transcript_9143/g.15408  ORF Transcript_9143/g.15408 Transcript_9143/m.15408 type:complete len:120 (+) Transcript_9143:1068-1427(+)
MQVESISSMEQKQNISANELYHSEGSDRLAPQQQKYIDPNDLGLRSETKIVIKNKALTRSMFTIDEEYVDDDGVTVLSSRTGVNQNQQDVDESTKFFENSLRKAHKSFAAGCKPSPSAN